MSLTSALLSGTSAAIAIIQQYIVNPTINGIPIECETYSEANESEISEQLIVSVGKGKQFVTDNIAPKPRTWTMSGWIAPTFLELSALSPVLQPILLLKIRQLRKYFNSRSPVLFTTKNREEFLQVGIKSMVFSSDPSIANRQPISLVIKEMPIINQTLLTGTDASPAALDNVASAPVEMGAVGALPITIGDVPGFGPLGI